MTETIKLIAERWQTLSQEEKNIYVAQSEEGKRIYEIEKAEY